ncbi:hypothetical protein [Flavobacterium pallidum]|uniref:C1q domain-containing protein n=1 Tax=Flavobacterium pallidum TaxID=2172098 RepID=A0A2S1SJA8_9FLAO|nr:hypothetical protein [Flavobacterium pallidum]AWI26429.1 hypothetical protein HYN49_11250 [Flavobacterium pallidum]
MKKIKSVVWLAFICVPALGQVGINTTNPKATLDVQVENPASPTNEDGFLIPKVSNFAVSSPVSKGLMVYLEDTENNNTQPDGFYFWTGSKWDSFSGWKLDGNTGTTAPTVPIGVSADKHFIGTTDAVDFAFATNGLERMRISSSGNIGIGKNNPTKRLDIDANNDFIRIEKLASKNTSLKTYYAVVDAGTGEIGMSQVENVAGQIMRIGIDDGITYSSTEKALRFKDNNDATEMGSVNFINSITGSSFTEGGSASTDKDLINLPAGTYRVTLKVNYISDAGSILQIGTSNSLSFKIILNNAEYSKHYTSFITTGILGIGLLSGGSVNEFVITDYIQLSSASSLYFATKREAGTQNYSIYEKETISGTNSYRSIIMVERLR